jgi:hypothetical protein
MSNIISEKGIFGISIRDDVEEAAWAQSDAVLDQYIADMRDKEGVLDTYAIKKKALELGRAAKTKINANKSKKGSAADRLFPMPVTDEEIEAQAYIPEKGTPAGAPPTTWGVHDGTGKIILNAAGVRGLLSQVEGKTVEERVANARKLAEKRGWIIPK